jgi:hypothetical protein
MGNKNKTIVVLLALLVVALLIYWTQSYDAKRNVAKQDDQKPVQEDSLGKPQNAAPGEIVSGFPVDLILKKDGAVISSSVTPYVDNHKQYTTTYATRQSIEETYAEFLKYLQAHKYAISKQQISPELGALYGTSATGDINVSIYKDIVTGKNTVIVSYLLKK